MRTILWLSEITAQDASQVGGKAQNLAELYQAGFPVPTAFCVTSVAYEQYAAANGLDERVEALRTVPANELVEAAHRLQLAFRQGAMSAEMHSAVISAFHALASAGNSERPAVAVRSSASAEDLPTASFAGQQETILNVRGQEQLLQAIQECWASLWSPRAVLYRMHQGTAQVKDLTPEQPPVTAVLVQYMLAAEAAGVAFSQDPTTGANNVIVEAAWGLGETVVGGQGDVDHYVVSRDTCLEAAPPTIAHKLRRRVLASSGGLVDAEVDAEAECARVLSPEQVRQIAETTLAIERHFHGPQDVEWALAQGELFILQSRPITTLLFTFFTDLVEPSEATVWTAGFLNERFPQPVSPLGWTLVQELLDELAFRAPLRYLGARNVSQIRTTRLYHGHPYVNLFVFQTLYKVFPNFLLPEDASRYFPDGKTELRREAKYPRSIIDPRFLVSMAMHFVQQPTVWSPWHNYRVWARFAAQHDCRSQQLRANYESLRKHHGTASEIWSTIQKAQALNAELLALHRWSLTWADLTYALLRRLLQRYAGSADAFRLCAALVAALPNKSVELNDALGELAQNQGNATFPEALAAFLTRYWHRSFSLDIYYPPFEQKPAQVLELLASLRAGAHVPHARERREAAREQARLEARQVIARGPWGGLHYALFQNLLRLTEHYMPLREEQRLCWQRTLALQRRLFLLLGQRLTNMGILHGGQHVFFLTKSELEAYVRGQCNGDGYVDIVTSREQQYMRLRQEFDAAEAWAYPPFVRGHRPLETARCAEGSQFQGRAISPGLARGRAVVVCSPDEFGKVQRGDILVTRGVDPGWTPLFSLISALIMEHGGQLSHGAVVAREYGLPTVAGLPGITQVLQDGDMVMVDGLSGLVRRIPNQ
jgi:pyruvate,water dikinase